MPAISAPFTLVVRYKNMKHLIILFIFCIIPTVIIADNDVKGHVAFFMLIPEADKDYVALFDDYNYYYSNLLPWLTNNKYSHSQHTSSPFTIKNLSFTKSDLNVDIGAILIKTDNSHKIIRGIVTDIDLIAKINEFYKNDP